MSTDAPSTKVRFQFRLLIAIFVWIVVSAISLYTAWQQSGHSAAWREQWQTKRQLETMGVAVTAYQQKYKENPTTFEKLLQMTNQVPLLDLSMSGGFIDGWSNSFVFSGEGTNCVIISYGRNGKLGGNGIDYDLTTKAPDPAESTPTFEQFHSNKQTHGMIKTALVCGALAGLLSFLTVRASYLTKRELVRLFLSLAATLIATLFISAIITALHMPSGH